LFAGLRIGKGEGFADLEWAMMCSMGAVNDSTVVVATCHDCQVLDLPEKLFGEHDLTVDYILTPTQVSVHDCNLCPVIIITNHSKNFLDVN
jgi:5-formyltetrahydrofolate cyclo-ligase